MGAGHRRRDPIMLIPGFNLAAGNYQRARRQIIVATILVALLALLLIGQIALWAAVRREQAAVASQLTRMEGELQRHQEQVRPILTGIPGDVIKRYESRVATFNRILEASSFSWTALLLELERSAPPGVFLSEIHPDLATGAVKLRGVARSFDDLTLLLRGLEQRTAFRDVYLLRQAERKAHSNGPEGLDFEASLLYQGRGQ